MYLESPHNPKVKAWAQLKTRKGRLVSGLYLAEGERLIWDALQAEAAVETVLWDAGASERYDALRTEVVRRAIASVDLSPAAFAAVRDTVTPQGVIAVVRMPARSRSASLAEARIAIVLHAVQDPGNLGTLLRSADAFGVRVVCAGTDTVDPFAPKVVRSSMGAIFRGTTLTHDTVEFIDLWRHAHPNGQVVAAVPTGAMDCSVARFADSTLFLIGNEAAGLPNEIARMADVSVRIPMESSVDSLNAAVAGSILLYESYRQRMMAKKG